MRHETTLFLAQCEDGPLAAACVPIMVIIVHGGAGRGSRRSRAARIDGCREAALEGWRILAQSGTALDAVEAAVMALEDNPLFNAGKGSSLNSLGKPEMDAALMVGNSLSAGAVCAVDCIPNPIHLARKIMEDGHHVLLTGTGALEFAREAGVRECQPESLIVEEQFRHWRKLHGTVGCVAVDRVGTIVAGTSTGGMVGKRAGRIGDSPLIGCGTYADDWGGVSCTGVGEAIIRVVLGKTTIDFLRSGCDPGEAARRALSLLEQRTGSEAGLVVVDRDGRIGYARNTDEMPICHIKSEGQIITDC